MQTQRNTELVKRIYAAFGSGDVPTIVDAFAPDGAISFEGASPAVPWHRTARGHGELPQFFAAIAATVEFEAFEPLAFVASDEVVAVRLHLRYRVKPTGKLVDEQQVHWWTLASGKVTDLRHFEDTRQVAAACV